MINLKANLSEKVFSEKIESRSIRDGFGEGLVLAGEEDGRVVCLTADLKESTRAHLFANRFPERFFDVGVAEQALVTVASGMANFGKIPFCTTYAVFSPGRTFEQIKVTVALNNVAVKIVGAHAGLGAGPYGATHQSLEDIALLRTLPNMVVVVPADSCEAKKATLAVAKNQKPSYLRLARQETPVFTTQNSPFEIGRAEILWDSTTHTPQLITHNFVAVVACGPLVYEALLAAKELSMSGLESIVVNCHTIKPIDEATIIEVAKKCGAVVSVEEHQVNGGLGSAVSEVLAKNYPVPMEFIGMPDSFGESGETDELLQKYGMKTKDIVQAAKKVIARKSSSKH